MDLQSLPHKSWKASTKKQKPPTVTFSYVSGVWPVSNKFHRCQMKPSRCSYRQNQSSSPLNLAQNKPGKSLRIWSDGPYKNWTPTEIKATGHHTKIDPSITAFQLKSSQPDGKQNSTERVTTSRRIRMSTHAPQMGGCHQECPSEVQGLER